MVFMVCFDGRVLQYSMYCLCNSVCLGLRCSTNESFFPYLSICVQVSWWLIIGEYMCFSYTNSCDRISMNSCCYAVDILIFDCIKLHLLYWIGCWCNLCNIGACIRRWLWKFGFQTFVMVSFFLCLNIKTMYSFYQQFMVDIVAKYLYRMVCSIDDI